MKEQDDKSKDFVNKEFKKAGFNHFIPDEGLRKEIDPRTPNFHDLKKQMVILGFGEIFAESLWIEMQKGNPKIVFPYQALLESDTVACELQFTRSKNNNYFLDQYTVLLKGTELETGLPYKKQTIPVEYFDTASRTCSLLETYNLLKGRWVEKDIAYPDGLYYKDWLKYDFTSVNVSGNYGHKHLGKDQNIDLNAAADFLSFVDYGQHKDRGSFVKSLSQGNKEKATIILSSGSRTVFRIEANPERNMLDVYLGNRRVYVSDTGDVRIPGLKQAPTDRQNVIPGYKNVNPLLKEKNRKRIKR